MKSTTIQTSTGSFRVRYYQERNKAGHYLAVFPDQRNPSGHIECLATVYADVADSWVSGAASADYLRNKCRRVSHDEVPAKLVERAESFE